MEDSSEPMNAVDAHRAQVEDKVEQLLQSLLEVGICTSNVQESAMEGSRQGDGEVWGPGGLLGKKINRAISHMSELYEVNKETGKAVPIPIEVIDHVDAGSNPDRWLKTFVDCVAHENMYINGIMNSFSDYEDQLHNQLRKAFPNFDDETSTSSEQPSQQH